jgi:hypothetical protein
MRALDAAPKRGAAPAARRLTRCAALFRSVSVPQRLLRGLQAYHLAPGDADAPPPEASKKDKKVFAAAAQPWHSRASRLDLTQAGINPAAVEHALNREGVRPRAAASRRQRAESGRERLRRRSRADAVATASARRPAPTWAPSA